MNRFRLALACLAVAIGSLLAWAGYFSADPLTLITPPEVARLKGHRIAVVYVSGDVGYKIAMGKQIGDRLTQAGIPVVAVNSLGYFRSKRTVKEVVELLGRAIQLGLKTGNPEGVVLIGHSFGADALQAALAELPPSLRTKVRAVILIVPTRKLFLRISPIEMLDWFEPDAATLPTLEKLDWVPLTCIYGAEEDDSPCPLLKGANVRNIALPGGHALSWNNAAVFEAVLSAIDAAPVGHITKSSASSHPIQASGGLLPKEQ